MLCLSQSPLDTDFVNNPYPFYEEARRKAGQLFYWEDYDIPCALSYSAVWAILRDRRMGREAPEGMGPDKPDHQAGFWRIEDHSLLELEPPRHTRLRGLILRAFTSRRIAGLEPEIAALADQLVADIKDDTFDLLRVFAEKLPVIIIARMLGVPESMSDQLLAWSHAMVSMYQARRTHEIEVQAANAASEFHMFLSDYVEHRRKDPQDDLITHLINAEEDGERLSRDELISTCVLLLNAGHEATVHTIGNGVLAMLQNGFRADITSPGLVDGTVEEMLRYDPPLHMFQRWLYEDVEIGPHTLKAGTKVACLLGAANRDPQRWENADRFDPARSVQTNVSFGAGVHFCIGAPLARLELKASLPVLFEKMPALSLAEKPQFSQTYHFHGLKSLKVKRG